MVLPKGWDKKTLGESCTLQRGFDLPKRLRVKGEHPLISSSGCIDSHNEPKVAGPGVVTGRSGSIGSLFYIEDDFWPLNTTLYVKNYFGNDPRFIFYLLKHIDLKRFASGAGVPTLNRNNVHSESILIPSDSSEQKRIVGILDKAFASIDKAIANTEKNLANARELFERLVADSIFVDPDAQQWESKLVADLAVKEKGSMRTGPFGSQLLHKEFVDEGIAVLGIDNAVKNEFSWGKHRFITDEKYEQLSRYTVHPGDVIITIMGTCGRCAVIPDDIPLAINTKHLCCITLDHDICLPEYLHAYFLYHPTAISFLTSKAKGAIMSGLNMGIIKKLPVRLPSLKEQKDIVGKVSEAKQNYLKMTQLYQQKLTNLQDLKQSILQKAFAGEL
ncbi:restriction endonuclease subunit S [Maridesulfovibrio salexigens]|uniref:Restriction modification system DNA specificity domain protein n=1 Tax=Maridesulfovibrio salexigens (strain ATCC 14822 / DSM 2638 / NCIMB 8403 / VKM B-1763) TaxID=526222 RepID=C6BRN8_MARSD|nr:restriction endonuclease subunit S [Maridesulfovibrio salexigens]ACS79478.1 restriction modification system DNA specificity domain protein [Maridesulfovibrio salexigens DSM 2638]